MVCTFARTYEIDETLENIKDKFTVLNGKIFLLKTISPQSELIMSYNIQMETRQDFLPKSIMVHRKKETNTIYTINALNELIMNINNGVLDKHYPIDFAEIARWIEDFVISSCKHILSVIFLLTIYLYMYGT